jgi:hypothetical protein
MDETTRIRRRTHGWPVIVALIVLALVVGYAIFFGGMIPSWSAD